MFFIVLFANLKSIDSKLLKTRAAIRDKKAPMTKNIYKPATKPTLYFIGVTTGKSSIMKLFPKWANHLQLGDCEIKGFDFKLHDDPEAYWECVDFIKNDPLSKGALVTTHKIDLLAACRDLFDILDPHAEHMGEISCISKQGDKLVGHAKDPITSGLAMENFIPENHWNKTGGEVFSMGAGGSTIAIASYLTSEKQNGNHPTKIHVSNRSQERLDTMRRVFAPLNLSVPIEYHLTPDPKDNDALVNALPSHSLVINATGLGKDAPGSPLTHAVEFPKKGIVWELNYRGDLIFLDQANAQKESKSLNINDGWVYFIHGWAQVMAEVFHIDIPTMGPGFDQLSQIAQRIRS